jgi:hypothetical protein
MGYPRQEVIRALIAAFWFVFGLFVEIILQFKGF